MPTIPTQHSGHALAPGIAQPDFEAAKTEFAARIHRLLEQRRVLPDAIAALLQVRESDLATLFQGRLATCSLDQLLRTLAWLGDDIDILIRPRAHGQTRGSLRVFKTESVGRMDHPDRRRGSDSAVRTRPPEPQNAGATAAPERAVAANKPELLDKWEVEEVTSLDITTIYRKMKAGDFPKPLRVTSKLIANLVLAPLDQHVRSNAAVRYYARYVDDMLLVADASKRSPSTSRRIARSFLPISTTTGSERGEMLLNAEALGRVGCRLRLQPSKLRGYVLTGRRGRDFLDTIERDVKLMASERRAFLLPDGLGSDSPLTALFVGSDDDTPVQVLREVDRLKVERYAASVAISKAAVGVELLDPNESAKWCHRQLSPLAGHLTSPEQWLEFLDLSLRALTVCIRASDVSTARSILRRHTVHFARLGSVRPSTAITWNGRTIAWPTVRRNLLRWYENRRVEDIVASVPLSELGARTARAFVRRLVGRYLRFGDVVLGPSAVASRARLLRAADLRTVDRETDLQRVPTQARVATRRWEDLDAQLRADDMTSTRVAQIDQFRQDG
jgi:predicted DNA-binding transcriptional regulator AlpA/predicted XRE-type DNA-binding protein